MWCIGQLFCSSLLVLEYNPRLNKYIYACDNEYHQRYEGWATTKIGHYGVNAVPDITAIKGDKIAVWGDSYVEAYHVNDQFKTPCVVNTLFENKGIKLFCYGVAISGNSIADYYYDIPKYDKLVSNTIAHYIVITSPEDVLPNQPADVAYGVYMSDPYRLEISSWKPKHQSTKKLFKKYGFGFLWEPSRKLLTETSLDFLPHVVSESTIPHDKRCSMVSSMDIGPSINFILAKLKKQTDKKIVLAYCPKIPYLENGQVVTQKKDTEFSLLLMSAAQASGIDFIDLSEHFVRFYRASNKFPRGFHNSKPGEGHFNRHGHRLVAERIVYSIINE